MDSEQLSENSRKLLDLLIRAMGDITPGDPETYPTYSEVHKELGLSLKGATYGRSLELQGLGELSEWIRKYGCPAITGLVVDKERREPGGGFFKLFEKDGDDVSWWNYEISRSYSFDWPRFLVIWEEIASRSWVMKITPDQPYKTSEYFSNLYGEGQPNVVGYGEDRNNPSKNAYYNRSVFFDEMKQGDFIFVVQGRDRIHGLVRISDNDVWEVTKTGVWDWFPIRRSVDLVYRFPNPVKTNAQTNMQTIIGRDAPGGGGIIREGIMALYEDEYFQISDLYGAHLSQSQIEEISESGIANLTDDDPYQEDQLGRALFAKYLVKRFYRLWKDRNKDNSLRLKKDSLVVHINAPWGAGKSNFLNQMRKYFELGEPEDFSGWNVVEFNAWQHQHMVPAWWPLLETITSTLLGKGSKLNRWQKTRLRIKDLWWRRQFAFGVASLVVTISSIALFVYLLIGTEVGGWDEEVKTILAALTGFTALFTIVVDWVFPLTKVSSSSTASFYEKVSKDPVKEIRKHFQEVLNNVDNPVVVYIDDLDRCRADFVVELVECLHNLFNHSKIVYLVAADREWIANSFSLSYEGMGSYGYESKVQIGYHFVEKLFQLNVVLPSIRPSTKKEFLNKLLGIKNVVIDREYKDENGRTNIFRSDIESVKENVEYEEAIELEQGLQELSSEEEDQEVEHRLVNFQQYIEANPRFIKLLVNSHGINMGIALMSGWLDRDNEQQVDEIIRWSIIALRFPTAASVVVERPDVIGKLKTYYELDELNLSERQRELLASVLRQTKDFIELLQGNAEYIDNSISRNCIRALNGKELLE